MKQRPKSITIICWFLIISGVISIAGSFFSLNNPMTKEIMSKSPIPLNIQFAMLYVGLVISITSGIAMLKGKNWARLLYVGWSIIGFIIALATSPMKIAMIPSLIVFAVVLFFMFRPISNQYFAGSEPV